jgi:hypothetical membrane protein
MTTITRIGIIIFAIAVLFGPIYTVVDYSVVSNLISELGAQHTKNNFIMIIAFFILGGSIAFDGIKNFQISLLPFIVFGLAMAVVGVFPHKPLDPSLEYNQTYQKLHGLIASIAGTAVTVGFIWRGLQTEKRNKLICFYMAIVAIVFPVLMVSFPKYKGIIQRAMYLQILGWLWITYPNTWLTKRFS